MLFCRPRGPATHLHMKLVESSTNSLYCDITIHLSMICHFNRHMPTFKKVVFLVVGP